MAALSGKTGWVMRMVGAGGLVWLLTACVPGQMPFPFPGAGRPTATLPARLIAPTQTPGQAVTASPVPTQIEASSTPTASGGSPDRQTSSIEPAQGQCADLACEPGATPSMEATKVEASPSPRPTNRPRTATPHVADRPTATATASSTPTCSDDCVMPTATAHPEENVNPTTPPTVAAPTEVPPTVAPVQPTTAPGDGYPGPGQPDPTRVAAPTEAPPTQQPGGYPGPGGGGGGGYPAP